MNGSVLNRMFDGATRRHVPGPSCRFLRFLPPALLVALALSSAVAFADGGQKLKIDTGDTAWVLASSALVLLMTPGLALFYGGMVRSKNVLGTVMQSFVAMGVIGIQWVVYGYSLAFGPDIHGIIGNLDWFGLRHVGFAPLPDYSKTIPGLAHMTFQCMFAVITPALITGAVAERMKFSTYLVFLIAWATLVYDPLAHWVWGAGGWLNKAGALDFAGGTVVHMSSGYSALVCALVLGRRKGYPNQEMRPHNLMWTLLGTGLLWFGWFGFNAGSALGANGEAALAFVNTNTATAAGAIGWLLIEWWRNGKPTALGAASGAVAGLVGITPACGFIGPMESIAVGAIAGVICFLAVGLKPRLGYDDTLDTFGVHGIGGTWGALATGLFACAAISGLPNNGLFFGNAGQMIPQIEGVLATLVYSVVVTFLLLRILDATMGLRIREKDEEQGLDLSQHGEEAYQH